MSSSSVDLHYFRYRIAQRHDCGSLRPICEEVMKPTMMTDDNEANVWNQTYYKIYPNICGWFLNNQFPFPQSNSEQHQKQHDHPDRRKYFEIKRQ